MDNVVLSVSGLKKRFPVKGGVFSKEKVWLNALDGVDFQLEKGMTMGLVGESGCGKSTLAKLILRLIEPSDGQVLIDSRNIFGLGKTELREFRKKIQIIFQDPYSSLNPRMTAGNIIGEPLDIHGTGSDKEKKELVIDMMLKVGLKADDIYKYPHEFSGGQRQRIGIARALILRPSIILADEPVSSLDVSVQAQVINLMNRLQKEFNLTYLIISHDLALIRFISDKTAVMYLGRIVEEAKTKELFENPRHPYTEALISAIPHLTEKKERMILKGEVPSPINPPAGCHFHPRCYLYAKEKAKVCITESPRLLPAGEKGHLAACHLRTINSE